MKKKISSVALYQNKDFLSGVLFSTLAVLAIGSIFYLSGHLTFQKISPQETFANSLSPRKSGPRWYTPPVADPSGSDQIAPTVTFVSPKDGSLVDPGTKSGSYYIVPVVLSASDNDRIAHVALYVDDVLDGLMYYSGPSYQSNVRVPNQAGSYSIKAIAYDYNGNPGEAISVVTVPQRGK